MYSVKREGSTSLSYPRDFAIIEILPPTLTKPCRLGVSIAILTPCWLVLSTETDAFSSPWRWPETCFSKTGS